MLFWENLLLYIWNISSLWGHCVTLLLYWSKLVWVCNRIFKNISVYNSFPPRNCDLTLKRFFFFNSQKKLLQKHQNYPLGDILTWLPNLKQQKSKQTESGKENTALWLNDMFPGLERYLPSEQAKIHSVGSEKHLTVGLMLQRADLPRWNLQLQPPHVNCCNWSCCRVWIHALVRKPLLSSD